ncbi:MAG: ATP-binding protein [Oligoflexales bacterium]|nr:ATP-binding protein [Oligoflexales bacterium]
MSVRVQTALYDAMECSLLQVECSYTRGFVGIQLIGHASEVCKNGLERALTALDGIGLNLPQKRVVVSLSPADSRKDGNHFDLPFAVALAILIKGETPCVDLGNWLLAAELSLDGRLQPVKGVISFAITAAGQNLEGVIIGSENLKEAEAFTRLHSSSGKLKWIAFDNLQGVLRWIFTGEIESGRRLTNDETCSTAERTLDQGEPHFDDMVLDEPLKKVAMVVATGLHSLLLYGTPGTGKSMFSSRVTSIIPSMEKKHHLEALKIHSCFLQSIPRGLLAGRPPFRAPHHQASAAAILGLPDNPGELALAHGGVLFLDEFPEFRRDVVEGLREPLETGRVRVSRAKKKVIWDSEITLIAACNACPCGWLGSRRRSCVCPSSKILAYRRKVSGPILDRIDVHVTFKENVSSHSSLFFELNKKRQGPSQTLEMGLKVLRARGFGLERNSRIGVRYNRDIPAEQMIHISGLEADAFQNLMEESLPQNLGKRGLVRSLRLARSLADLEERPCINKVDLTQALAWLPESCAKERGDSAYGL